MTSNSDDEPFLSRWARRKRDSRTGERTETAAAQPAQLPQNAAKAPDKDPAAEPELDLSKLPKIEDLTAESDIAAFLDKRVPAVLRNAALNRMWTLDPTIRDFIEVAEYQWNWNVPGGAPFYELMEPGTGASTILADATSAIVRPLASASETEAQDQAPAVPTERDDTSPAVERLEDHQLVASTPEATDLRTDLPSAMEPGLEHAAAPQIYAAAQHPEEQAEILPRRRHGGALPV